MKTDGNVTLRTAQHRLKKLKDRCNRLRRIIFYRKLDAKESRRAQRNLPFSLAERDWLEKRSSVKQLLGMD